MSLSLATGLFRFYDVTIVQRTIGCSRNPSRNERSERSERSQRSQRSMRIFRIDLVKPRCAFWLLHDVHFTAVDNYTLRIGRIYMVQIHHSQCKHHWREPLSLSSPQGSCHSSLLSSRMERRQ